MPKHLHRALQRHLLRRPRGERTRPVVASGEYVGRDLEPRQTCGVEPEGDDAPNPSHGYATGCTRIAGHKGPHVSPAAVAGQPLVLGGWTWPNRDGG